MDALPRDGAARCASEILQLVAMNQVDLIDPLIANETERAIVARIVADRRNLRDRISLLALGKAAYTRHTDGNQT